MFAVRMGSSWTPELGLSTQDSIRGTLSMDAYARSRRGAEADDGEMGAALVMSDAQVHDGALRPAQFGSRGTGYRARGSSRGPRVRACDARRPRSGSLHCRAS